ncbi:hypothetical protein C2E23DRAFT_349938 [Lenzites betulinus]|nr:hypothetical protein C2E23DRAFT_349938 [Lenzites betulinus]
MAGRRLTISALLCADEQPPDHAPPPPASSQPPPFTPPTSRPHTTSADLRDPQVISPGFVEFRDDAFRSRPYPDHNRDSHNVVVPLSVQHIHPATHAPSLPLAEGATARHSIWRGHGGHDADLPDVPVASSSRPLVSPVSRERDPVSYHLPPSLPQALPRPIPTSRRTSDPREGEYRTYETPSYFSRPRSSTSAQSDPLLSPYTYPPPLPRPGYLRTPEQILQPASSTSATRHPSHSPVQTRPPSHSPNNLYRPMSQSAPHGGGVLSSPSQIKRSSQSPITFPGSGSPSARGDEAFAAFPSRLRSASQTHLGSPPALISRTSSAAALPNLLNAEPPRSPAVPFGSHGSPGGLGALDALVQAATEERRRLSGELPTAMEWRESARRASLSPVLNRNPPLPPVSHSPLLQRSPPLPSPRVDTRVSSLAFISLGQDGEPPTKRRKRSGSSNAGSSALPSTVPPVPNAFTRVSAPASPPPPVPAALHDHIIVSPSYHPHAPEIAPSTPLPSLSNSRTVPHVQVLASPSPPPRVHHPVPSSAIAAVPAPPPDVTLDPAFSPVAATAPSPTPLAFSAAPLPRLATPPPTFATSKPRSISQLLISEPSEDRSRVAEHVVPMPRPRSPSPAPPPTPPVLAEVPEEPQPPPEIVTLDVDVQDEDVETATDLEAYPVKPEHEEEEEPAEARVESEVPMEDDVQVEDGVRVEDEMQVADDARVEVEVGVDDEVRADVHVPVDDEAQLPDEIAPESGAMTEDEVKMEEIPDASLTAQEPPTPDHPIEDAAQVEVRPPSVQPTEAPREQDAHEWLLEHYATDSPSSASRRASPVAEVPPDSPDTSADSPPPQVKPEEVQTAFTISVDPAPELPKGRSRTPTPLALLEEELDRTTPEEALVPEKARSPSTDADLAMELDLAASASSPAAREEDGATSNDLDDELLSLLDEKPRHPHSHMHSHAHSHPHTHIPPHPRPHTPSHAHAHSHTANASHVSPAPVHAEKPPQVKDVPTTMPAGGSAPPSSSAPTPSERVVMPPPIAPPSMAAKSATPSQAQSSAPKPQKTEGTAASAGMKKKPDPAAKVSFAPYCDHVCVLTSLLAGAESQAGAETQSKGDRHKAEGESCQGESGGLEWAPHALR